VAAKLNDEGIICSVGLVADLMREMGLAAVQPRAYKRTTIPDDQAQIFQDHLDRKFNPADYTPGQALVSDITYLRTGQGWVYLATIIDLATRMEVGWQLAEHMRTSLVIEALDMARTHGRVADGALMHSDHGTQYTSAAFTAYCAEAGIIQSMGRTGVCWDNAVAETFFASLKNEMYYQQVFTTRPRARMAVAEYIEVFYNRQRPHSSLGYLTPVRAWNDHQALAATASTQAA